MVPASEAFSLTSTNPKAVFLTHTTVLPSFITPNTCQLIRFGTGLEFLSEASTIIPQENLSAVVLPCIFGSRLEGPLLLATGKVPQNVPYHEEQSLQTYYEQLEGAIVFVDERMTDNARNLATPWRINAVFVIQMTTPAAPKDGDIKVSLNFLVYQYL
jgi:hypothetical protein